jgi:hypothetical protein
MTIQPKISILKVQQIKLQSKPKYKQSTIYYPRKETRITERGSSLVQEETEVHYKSSASGPTYNYKHQEQT